MRAFKLFACACLAVASAPAPAADERQGRALYETNCGGCHYERVHQRKTTHVRTIALLKEEIARWAVHANRTLSPAELDDIAEYLDRSHYRLAK